MNLNIIKDLLRRIEAEQIAQRKLLEQLLEKTSSTSDVTYTVPPMTEMQAKMARVREARGKNTGRA